jgi:enamine deaminase RidA (YjgF/YER057c/UK114 family)
VTATPHQLLHPAGWRPTRGYANGVAATGRILFLGGTIAWDAEQNLVAGDFVGQTRQCLRNIVAVLAEGGARPEHLVRLTWYVTSREEYLASLAELGRVYREELGTHYPAMALVQVAGLLEPLAKVEIEATAVIP